MGRGRTNQRSPEPAVGGELQLHGGHLLAAAAEHEHGAAAGDGVAGDDAAVVPRGAGEAPLRHVLPAHARPPGVEYLGKDILRINKGSCKADYLDRGDWLAEGVEAPEGHDVAAHVEGGASLPRRGHLAPAGGPLPRREVVLIAAAGHVALRVVLSSAGRGSTPATHLSPEQRAEGGGGQQLRARGVARGAGVERAAAEHGEGAAAALRHEGGEGRDERRARHRVRAHVHHGHRGHRARGVTAWRGGSRQAHWIISGKVAYSPLPSSLTSHDAIVEASSSST